MTDIWAEKYRPQTLDDFVFRDPMIKTKVEQWVTEGSTSGHFLFSGETPGTGKTSLALLLMTLLQVPRGDVKFVNGSRDNSVEYVRTDIISFVASMPQGHYKYVIIDEADRLSHASQDALRNVLEKYAPDSRFILTGNAVHRFTEPLMSRVQHLKFSALDRDDFLTRVGAILFSENIEFDLGLLEDYVNRAYPDLRKCINDVQFNAVGKKLVVPSTDDLVITRQYITEAVLLITANQFKKARELIVNKAQVEDYPSIYRFMYENLGLWAQDESRMDDAILVIADGARDHSIAADPEINLTATLVRLNRIRSAK